MRHLALLALLCAPSLSSIGCQSGGGGGGGNPEIKTEDQKTIYALGLSIGRNVSFFHLTPQELDIVKKGMSDMITGQKPLVEMETYGPKLMQFAQARSKVAAEKEKENSKAYLDKAAQEPGAVRLPSGIVYRTLKPGSGESPGPSDRVKVHYHGTLTDGTVFDSSVNRGEPAEFPLNGVVPCWTEGLQKMKVGEKARLVCPSSVAYGDQGRPPKIPGGATLVFDIELLEVKKGAATAPGASSPMMPHGTMMPGGHPPTGMPMGGHPPMPGAHPPTGTAPPPAGH
jgi:FKBP-type peptidyl-prolyl cis-trans isomerase FkpA